MSRTSIIMMIITLGFYGIGFIYLLNKAFNSKKN
ncbi:DUF4234 domain-containing protein [Thermotalea metallivorans]|uniref:Uncharacterized protein n=1 Tax=Thermotalea metallivorans TaxID=520762 RepID=A0A140KZL4_9FIRM|nr:DUF4234 domain-containing protein [Thermotalea metallivorans]KXG73739.1 hypothetical protein AN619_29370 [Thermotalea metallivorans]